jgi:hypothetical protein
MRIYSIKDKLYQITYKIYIGDDEDELVQKSGANVEGNFDAFTWSDDRSITIAFVEYEGQKIGIDLVAHEAYHAMHFLFTSRGVSIENKQHEHVAYYLGWLVGELWNIIQKHEQHKNRERNNTE